MSESCNNPSFWLEIFQSTVSKCSFKDPCKVFPCNCERLPKRRESFRLENHVRISRILPKLESSRKTIPAILSIHQNPHLLLEKLSNTEKKKSKTQNGKKPRHLTRKPAGIKVTLHLRILIRQIYGGSYFLTVGQKT